MRQWGNGAMKSVASRYIHCLIASLPHCLIASFNSPSPHCYRIPRLVILNLIFEERVHG
jgi:hypothetical protein